MKLRNRNQSIPLGFKFTQAETSFEAPANLSFNGVVDAVVKHRLGNGWLSKKHGWSTDWDSVADEIDSFNALRMKANPKWAHFIIDEDGGSSFSVPFRFPNQSRVGAAVGAVKRVAAGVGVLLDWLGSSGRAVPKELAEKRAEICILCPQNRDGDWTTMFTGPVSEMLRMQMGIRNDLKLTTSKDDQLHVCQACSCPLKLKVHAPLGHILDNMNEETKARLNPVSPLCWILAEQVQVK